MKPPASHRPPFLAALLGAAFACSSALAGTVQVVVRSADGQPAPNTVVLVQPRAAWSVQPLPPPAVIAQQDIRFVPYVAVIPVGGTLRFVNQDRFDHHVRSLPGGPLGTVAPAREFELRMPALRPGGQPATSDLKVEVPGVIALGCHLHGSMRGHVYVSSTPWAAVTDANGRATIAHVPDGDAELHLWHPDQLVDQRSTPLQVSGAAPIAADLKLNFTPRAPRRHSTPSPMDNYPSVN